MSPARTFRRALAALILALVVVEASGADHPAFVPGRVLVKFRDQVAEPAAQAALQAIGARESGKILSSSVRILALKPGDDESRRAAELARRPDVEFAELDRSIVVDGTVDDPLFSGEWHLPIISAPTAWDTTVGSSSVIIAILDTGTDATHPDLSANIVAGWNFYDNNADTSDVYGHGTATAGTAAACGNNGIGVASVAYGCRIMPMRITDTSGVGYWSAAANALHWAADHGARVANLSFGGISESSTVSDAANYFQQHGGVVAVSAGNDGLTKTSPDNPYMLVVSATDQTDTITSWSSRGSNLDVSAPGIGIPTTTRGGGYGNGTGTSFSAPIVAGVAALVISAKPSLSGTQVRAIVKQSADDLGDPGWDPLYGAGRVNAARAVALAVGTTATPAAPTITQQPSDRTVAEGQTATFTIAASGSGLVYQWQRSAPGATTYAVIAGATATSYTTPSVYAVDGGSRFRCVVSNGGGSATSASATLSVTVTSVDTTPPVISAIVVSGITPHSATISWTTNEPADSQVQYGPTSAYGSSSTLDPTLVTAHSVKLSGLDKKKTYHFRVLSRDAAGNLATSTDGTVRIADPGSSAAAGDLTFTTADEGDGGEKRCGLGAGIALLGLASLLANRRIRRR